MILKARQPSNRDLIVVRFRSRHPQTSESPRPHGDSKKREPNILLLLSLAKYESDEVNYDHRMIVNGLAFAVSVALIATGAWLASNLHE